MTVFEDLFFESRGKPVEYRGQTLVLSDDFPIPEERSFRCVFEEVNSDWRQGVLLEVNGEFLVAGHQVENALVLWQDTAPAVVEVQVSTSDDVIQVRNVWDTGDGVMHSWHNGAAMVVDPTPTGRRYHCNDGRPDDDLDDLVFRLECR